VSPTISISGYRTCTLTQAGQAACRLYTDDDQDVQEEVLPGRYLAISTHGGHTCAIDTAGEIACWGDALAEPPPPGRYKTVSTSEHHACALTQDGEAACWRLTSVPDGQPVFGEAEAPPGRYVAISTGFVAFYDMGGEFLGSANTCALSEEREAVCWGYGAGVAPGPYTAIASTGGSGFCGVTDDGRVECRGQTRSLTAETTAFSETLPPDVAPPNGEATRYTTVAASWTHVCALTTKGQAVCGTDPHSRNHMWVMHPPDPAPDRYIAIDVSYRRACALTESGEAVCWGVTANKVAPPDPPPGRYVAVSDGPFHTCALTEDGEAVCWGWNNYGQSDAPEGRYTAISAGGSHTCALAEDGEAVCWGYGRAEIAPREPLSAISTGRFSTCALTEAGEITCSGDAAPNRAFNRDAPSGHYTAISSGEDHTCAIAAGTGALECWFAGWSWPDSYEGPFMAVDVNGFIDNFSTPYVCALTTDGEARCWSGPFGEGGSVSPGPFVAIAVGTEHACALTADGEAVCWGSFNLGPADPPPGRYTAISAASFRTCAVTVEGLVVCWGDTDYETNESTP
ncbi:MAG: hypothetical protein F4081_00580, partial [Dehalococcoidia bacterium]|nr:hypothetical protein [Dehalococcoidia bacterium]